MPKNPTQVGVPTLTKSALIWLIRGIKTGDWLWLILATILASASISLVKQISQTVQLSMLETATQSLGADLVLKSSRPLNPTILTQANELGLETTTSISLTTMLLIQNDFQLIQLKGIDHPYPLKGKLATTNSNPTINHQEIWLDNNLKNQYNLNLNNNLELANQKLKISNFLTEDNLIQSGISQFSPQAIITLQQLKKLNLLNEGARATYEILFAGDPTKIKQLAQTLEENSQPSWQIIYASSPNEDIGQALDTAWLFLDLSALATLLIAGLALLIASDFYLNRWIGFIALMRSWGATSRQVAIIFGLTLTYLAFGASLIGILLGNLSFHLITPWLAEFFNPLTTPTPIKPNLLALAGASLTLWAFSLPAYLQAINTQPQTIFRSASNKTNFLTIALTSTSLIALLGWIILEDLKLLWILPIILLGGLTLYLIARLALKLLALIQPKTQGILRISLASLLRSPNQLALQLISLGLVIFILVFLAFIRHDLLNQWQNTLPENSPNTFVFNIQTNQKKSVESLINTYQINAELTPMLRARLVAINHKRIQPQTYEGQAKRLLEREANIAELEKLKKTTQLINPDLHTKAPLPTQDLPWVSVEKSLAESLNIQLKDTLTFNFAGQERSYQVTSFREVNWQSMQMNFFFIIQPTQPPLPRSYITNFYNNLNTQDTSDIKQQIQQLNGVIWLDASRIIKQISTIMNQATQAISLLFMLTFIASLLVIFSAIQSSQLARHQLKFILTTLGATKKQLTKIWLTEFTLLGLLTGIFGASLAQISSIILAKKLLNLDPSFSPQIWLSAIGISLALLLTLGFLTQIKPASNS